MSDSEEVGIFLQLIKHRFGVRLDESQLEEVKEKIKDIIEASCELRDISLSNFDEPYSIFKPYTGEG
jgi:hypothetical protein